MEEEIVIEPPLYFAPNGVHIWSTDFHPRQDVLAAALINGHVEILKYSPDDVVPLVTVTDAHRSSVRHCQFNPSGNTLASCGEDRRLGFIDSSGQVAHLIRKAHPNPINRVHFANDTILLSGDDNGMVKVWDLRSSECIFDAQDQSEAITGLLYDEEHTNVLSTSLDGTIAIYDIRQGFDSPHKLYAKSDSVDEELHGIQAMKHGKYLICPSSEHSVLIYRRDSIQTFIDRVVEQPGAVEAVLKIDEHTFLTGCEDGYVRAYSLKPNKLLRVVGQHEEDEHFPIQSLSLSRCRSILASTSHDNSIKFYDVNQLVRQRAQPRSEPEPEDIPMVETSQKPKIKEEEDEDNFEDVSDSSDSDDDEMESESEQKKPKKKKKKNQTMKQRQAELKKDNQRKFFEGM